MLISADMDYLATVRDLLRGRVSVMWVHSSAVQLSQSTLRQLEEATRPSSVREPRPISELATWEQVMASGYPTGEGGAGAGRRRGGGGGGGGGGRRRRRRRRHE